MTSNRTTRPPFLVIAVDGGAASGKSSTSRALAERFNFLHVDTGSHYRAVALAALEAAIEPRPGPALDRFLNNLSLGFIVEGRESRICLAPDIPIDDLSLRSAEVNQVVSAYAALPAVRTAVRDQQRGQIAVARQHHFDGLIMDGRDIGTVILNEADLKIFLVADPATRRQRRLDEGGCDSIEARDHTDSSRTVAPLKPASDAVVIDNSRLSLDGVVDRISLLVRDLCHR